jgi:hypothetical protein
MITTPSTLPVNNNESTQSATADDEVDDDATVQTSNSNSTKQAWMSFNIKLLLTSKQGTSDNALQHAMLSVLETIDREVGNDVKIFDGNKQQVTEFQFQAVTLFRSKFPVSRHKAHKKHNRSPTAWVLFTLQTRLTLKSIPTHPMIAQVLGSRQCRMIHHQWPLEVTDVTSIGFFIGETPTYKLSSTFRVDLCTLIEKKTKIHRRNIPMFQVALTVVCARMENPETKKLGREACTAFELQVPVGQREAMEKILKKTFLGTTANDLQFIHYVQRHVQLDVFYRAIQMQRCHEESYHVVAVEGIHPDDHFVFETKLRKHIPEIKSVLLTSKSTAHNNHGQPIGRYNILCKKSNFSIVAKKLHQEFTGLYHQYLQDEKKELWEKHQPVRVASRLPRSDDSSGTIRRTTFFTHSASIFEASQIDWEYNMEFPSVIDTNISAPKQSCPSSPSITSGVTGMSPLTLELGSPSYASVAARQTPDPDIVALKEKLAELKTIIQAQQQQLQQTSAPPAPNPPAMSLPPELAMTIQNIVTASMSSLCAEIAEL